MAKVDFYVLQQSGEPARQRFACRLAEKAWRLNNSVHIRTSDRRQAEQLDELLWTFRDGSFVPHEIFSAGSQSAAPITIGYAALAPAESDLLINLSAELPGNADAFPRIAEIVISDDSSTRTGRKRYADYRQQGHSLDTHKL